MGTISVLTNKGDETIEWDPAKPKSVEKAKKEYDKLKKDGYEFYEVAESKGKRVTRFNKKLGKVIAAPGIKSAADKKAGTRPKAQAGGPKTRIL